MRIQCEIYKLKVELKLLVAEYRKYKADKTGTVKIQYNWYESYRSKHIAYCMLRGRTLEQIEPKLRDPNSYIHARVRKEAARIISEVLNPKPVEPAVPAPIIQKPAEVKKEETLWTKAISFLS